MRSREEYRTNSRHYAVFYSRGHHCGGIGINYQTHTIHTHTHNCMCTQHNSSPYVQSLWPAAYLLLDCLASRCLHTAVLTSTRNCFVSVYNVVVLGL